MKQRVCICTASAFLAIVIRKTLARSPRLEPTADLRDAKAAAAALREANSLAVVDAELLRQGPDGAALRAQLMSRRGPTILIDARQRGLPDDLQTRTSLISIRGRVGGELDLEVIENELLAAVGSALRHRDDTIEELAPPVMTAHLPDKGEAAEPLLQLIVLGVSTGGPALLLQLLKDVTEPAIPMLIVQHMPQSETLGYAARLAEETGLSVREAASGPLPPAGTIGVLRGGSDFRIVRRRDGLGLREAVIAGNPFHPNIDEILSSAAAADVAVGAAILTGMGHDGAAGALTLADKGLPVVAQRPDTCAVAGMPQAAINNGAARAVQSPEGIARTLNRWSEAVRRGAAASQGRGAR